MIRSIAAHAAGLLAFASVSANAADSKGHYLFVWTADRASSCESGGSRRASSRCA